MKTKLICIFLFSSLLTYSQKNLIYQEDVSKAAIYTDGNENSMNGMVEIECSASIPLTFASAMLGRLTPDTVIDNGETINYKIILNRNPRYLEQDELHLTNTGYWQLSIPLENVKRKEKKYIRVYDPNMEIELSCYLSTRQRADLSFEKALYQQARDEYQSATECWDYEKDLHIEKRIQDIDSINVYIQNAEAAYSLSDFRRAGVFYQKAFNLNQNDKVLGEKRENAARRYLASCSDCFNTAERYYTERNFEQAKVYYEEIVKQDCNQFDIAKIKLNRIVQPQRHSLNFEFSANTPIGVSTGNYYEHYKIGMYLSLRFNPQIFELIYDDEKKLEKAEADVSFGWTIMLYKPIWLFFGTGFTAICEYVDNVFFYPWDIDGDGSVDYYYDFDYWKSLSPNLTEDDFINYDPKGGYEVESRNLEFRGAVSPEIGLLGKIPIAGKNRITLRYTLQYRFEVFKAPEFKSSIGKTQHVFGIGVCF
jgi:tetratricopeptide (TPR) repeat protein